MGRELAKEHPADADLVIGVPDSGVPAAIGYAQEMGLPLSEAMVKNRYVGRTFIQPDQHSRQSRDPPQVQPAARRREGQARCHRG
jgi:amidophosphoribosyltransferase